MLNPLINLVKLLLLTFATYILLDMLLQRLISMQMHIRLFHQGFYLRDSVQVEEPVMRLEEESWRAWKEDRKREEQGSAAQGRNARGELEM